MQTFSPCSVKQVLKNCCTFFSILYIFLVINPFLNLLVLSSYRIIRLQQLNLQNFSEHFSQTNGTSIQGFEPVLYVDVFSNFIVYRVSHNKIYNCLADCVNALKLRAADGCLWNSVTIERFSGTNRMLQYLRISGVAQNP